VVCIQMEIVKVVRVVYLVVVNMEFIEKLWMLHSGAGACLCTVELE